MPHSPQTPLADLDRAVLSEAGPHEPSSLRVSELTTIPRWILLGEPGSGKSTVFRQQARREGAHAITARKFIEGARPPGAVIFIDAVEEYRIGQPGRDRWLDLVDALAAAPYTRWRLACRAISVPPSDLTVLRRDLGEVEVWTLDQLQRHEQIKLLGAMGEADPEGFVQRLEAIGSEALLGNPFTIGLVLRALKAPGPALHTRGEVFARAVQEMAYEVNDELPERPDRPAPSAVLEAAERACGVMMLSARDELWLHQIRPPSNTVVTRSDLRPAEVDTEALRFAVDTPLFRSEGGRFLPTHRTIAEFLAGRGLANAVDRTSGSPPALPLRRALALLSGRDGRPAPALAGAFAWFVSMLAQGPHADRAALLIDANPELVLAQGDPALLPTRHKRILLAATGRGDPWFLSALRGSSAVGGLASHDIAPELEVILLDKGETSNRRLLVLEALRLGRPLPELLDSVEAVAGDMTEPEWLRRRAVSVLIARASDVRTRLRRTADAIASETTRAGVEVRLAVMEGLVGRGGTSAEIRAVLAAYAATGDGVMGYARDLGAALEAAPPPDLFDAPLPGYRKALGQARSFEISSIIQEVLAAQIRREAATLTPQILLRWLANAGLKQGADPERHVREAIADWIGGADDRSLQLFEALIAQSHRQPWRVQYEFGRLTGMAPPGAAVDLVLTRLAAALTPDDVAYYAELAFRLVSSETDDSQLYWRVWDLLAAQPATAELLTSFSQSSIDDWRSKEAARKREQQAASARGLEVDRAWLAAHQVELASGAAIRALTAAAHLYAGGHNGVTSGTGWERVQRWAGEDLALQIEEGWRAVASSIATTPEELADDEAALRVMPRSTICACHLAAALERGLEPGDPSPTAALAALNGRSCLSGGVRELVSRTSAQRLVRDAEGLKVLERFWARTMAGGADERLPHASDFRDLPAVGAVLDVLLGSKPDRPFEVLRACLPLLVAHLSFDRLRALVAEALAQPLSPDASAVWTFTGFMLDPAAYETAFMTVVSRGDIQGLLGRFNNGSIFSAFQVQTQDRTTRDHALARLLAPLFPAEENQHDHPDSMSQVVAAAVDRLAKAPTREASNALADLSYRLGATSWSNLLRHQSAAQTRLRSEAAFKAPEPLDVARALVAGRPATARDLQAVVSESLEALALDIRVADTTPWKGFWNNPDDAEERTPKIENDCRDLLTDRLRDRLSRFGLSANRAAPEARSGNERRVDLLLIGEEIAALPLEAKRHMNPEIWTAPLNQLAPYAASAVSAGRGVYLIFWFGVEAGPVPKCPPGVDLSSAEALRAELVKSLSPSVRELIDVIVIDVSAPPPKEVKPGSQPKPRRRRAAAAAAPKTSGPES